jgi:hypothetical protein
MLRITGVLNRASVLGAAVATMGLVLGGCSRSQSANVALDNALAAAGAQKESIVPFAGNITIDGGSPGDMGVVRTLVVLWNTKNPPKGMPPYAACDEDGSFEFHTYDKADGVPTGNYVVCFVQLEGGLRFAGPSGWRGKDRLNNLYSDPDKNKEDKDLVVDLSQKGNSDWHYDLKFAGREPVENPGANAIKRLH